MGRLVFLCLAVWLQKGKETAKKIIDIDEWTSRRYNNFMRI